MAALVGLHSSPGENEISFFKGKSHEIPICQSTVPAPLNKGRLVGQKAPLKPKEIWAIRTRLRLPDSVRDLAFFNFAIDSKL